MPTQVSQWQYTEQPINWGRAFLTGAAASALMMGFIDIFNMMGVADFSLESYLGSMVFFTAPHATHAWTVGLAISWLVGGLFGFGYAYFFEYVFKRATVQAGLLVGLGHAVLAAVAIFPFFNTIHDELHTGLYPSFGVLGSGIGAPTTLVLIFAHLFFGMVMGTFYGPVRVDRALSEGFEPGVHGFPGEPDVIGETEDPSDRTGTLKPGDAWKPQRIA